MVMNIMNINIHVILFGSIRATLQKYREIAARCVAITHSVLRVSRYATRSVTRYATLSLTRYATESTTCIM